MPVKTKKELEERYRQRRAFIDELEREEINKNPARAAIAAVSDPDTVLEPTEVDRPDPIARNGNMQPWRMALTMALKRKLRGKGNPQALHRIADRVVAMACAGDMQAIAEIGNRLDGKAMQPSEMTVTKITQVSDEDLERRLAERLAEAGAALLSGPGRAGGADGASG